MECSAAGETLRLVPEGMAGIGGWKLTSWHEADLYDGADAVFEETGA